MLGKNITAFNDTLFKISEQELYDFIRNSSDELINTILRLRDIAQLDQKKYKQLKTMLPYFTCANFNPPIRKTENFTSINCFILDIDHLNEKELTPESLKFNLSWDNHVVMAFTSPSGNGLKILFRLKEKCFDPAQFRIFYKLFLKNFSEQYHLNQVIDPKTCDVTRACFLSHDPDCFYNPKAEPLDINAFINFSNTLEVREIQAQLTEFEKKSRQMQPDENPVHRELSPEVLIHIRQKLNPNIRTKRKKFIFIPEELNRVVDRLTQKLNSYQIEVKAIEDINYGKKFVLSLQNFWAELNVFYGKKGFSVVKTPKRGSNEELADIGFKLLCEELM